MKKKLYSVAAAVSVSTLLIAGTFAWTNFNSSIINNFFGLGAGQGPQERAPGGTLHNDFEEGKDYRDVYIENWGTEPLIVRIQLSEYMEIGEGAGNKNGAENNHAVSIVDGASLDDVSTWTHFNGNLESGINRSADGFRYHWNWTMGGYKRYFPAPEHLRGTQDANGVDFVSTTSPVGNLDGIDIPTVYRRTLDSQVISMAEWRNTGMPIGNFWVVDTDGFSYWAAPLAPEEATGLLLHKVELVNVPEYDYFYAINVAAQMATVDNHPDNYQRLLVDASDDASILIHQVARRIRIERTTDRVLVISDGNEHEALRNWNHGSSTGYNVGFHSSGPFKRAAEVADELTAFLFNDDFQIIIEGDHLWNQSYYYFYKLTDGEWLKVLAVFNELEAVPDGLIPDGLIPDGQVPDRQMEQFVFLTNGELYDIFYWDLVLTDDFLELLQPGEYILDVGAFWGDSGASNAFNNFFRFIK